MRTESEREALIELGLFLKQYGYSFTTISPSSHRRVLERSSSQRSKDYDGTESLALRDLFGWSREVEVDRLPRLVVERLEKANTITSLGSKIKSNVRFSTLDGMIFLHSSFPTSQVDSVFFGPDSYRFVRFLINSADQFRDSKELKIADIGCGSGVGGIALYHHLRERGSVSKIFLADISDRALQAAEINLRLNEVKRAEVVKSDLYSNVSEDIDLFISNPPFIMDEEARTYRHGGADFGTELSIRILQGAKDRLNKDAMIALYTGTCFVNGHDVFLNQARALLSDEKNPSHYRFDYQEIDPDIFGEELSTPLYRDVERIAAVGMTLTAL